jgi:hypothetical protein
LYKLQLLEGLLPYLRTIIDRKGSILSKSTGGCG